MKSELFDVLTRCDSLQEFVDASAALIQVPYWVMDHTYSIIATSSKPDAKKYMDRLWDGKSVLDHVKNWQACGLLDKLSHSQHVVEHEEAGVHMILGDVVVHGQQVGRVTFFQAEELSKETAELVLQALSVYFHRAKTGLNTTVLQQAFLSLLQKTSAVEEAVSLMHRTGWNEKPLYCISVLQGKDRGQEIMIGEMHQILMQDPLIPMVLLDGNIVVLQSPGHSIQGVLDMELFRVGNSQRFVDLNNLDSYLKQALYALKVGKGQEEYFSTHIRSYLFETLSNELDPRSLIDYRILKMMEYDRQYATEYGLTMRTYLETGQNKQYTAELLHVHLNTVKYRLVNCAQLFDLFLPDDEEVLGTAILLSVLP